MELLPGFALLVGTSLFDATAWGYGLFWLIVLVAVVGAIAGPLIIQSRRSPRWHRAAMVLAGSVVAGVPAVVSANGMVTFLVSFILLAIAFWRGVAVSAEAPSHDEVQRRFAYGFGILFFGILWVVARGIIGERQVWQMLAEAGIAFVVVAMLALVMARVAQVREPGAGAAIALAVLFQLGALLLLSFLALQLFALDLAGLAGHAMQPVFDAVGRDLTGLLGYITDPVDRFIQLIRPHAKSGAHVTPPTPPANDFHGKRPKYHPPLHSPLVAIAAVLFMLALAAAIGYAVWRTVPRSRSRPAVERPYREERRSLMSLSAWWRTMLSSVRAFLRRRTQAAGSALAARGRRLWGPSYPEDPVRRIYAQLLRRSGALGLSLPTTSTPLEFLARLTERWPEGTREFDLITQAYMRRRYGEATPEPGEVTGLRANWQRLRHTLKGPGRVATRLERGRVSLAGVMAVPQHEQPMRPFPRYERAGRPVADEQARWRPTGITLAVLSFSLPALVIITFLVILAIASGRLG